MALPRSPRWPEVVRIVHEDTGREAHVPIAAYRNVWYDAGWRSPEDDPDWDGVGPVDPTAAASFRQLRAEFDALTSELKQLEDGPQITWDTSTPGLAVPTLVPRVTDVIDLGGNFVATVKNEDAETSLLAEPYTVEGGRLAAGSIIEVVVTSGIGGLLNSTGTDKTATLRIKVDESTLLSCAVTLPSSATGRGWVLHAYLWGFSFIGTGIFGSAVLNVTGLSPTVTGIINSGPLDLTAPHDWDVTVQLSAKSNDLQCQVGGAALLVA